MKITFWGVRGSIPVPGVETSKWGGNSSCVEVSADGTHPIVLDAGSGCRNLGKDLLVRPGRRLDMLMTHFHADHLLGFPFFPPIFAPSFQIAVYVPEIFGLDPVEFFSCYLNGIFHPLRVPAIPSRLQFMPVSRGKTFECGDFKVRASPLNHPGGAFGYRIEHGRTVLAYITDTAPLALPDVGVAAGHPPTGGERLLISLMQDADLVLFDTMFTFDEYLERMDWGHSYPEYAVALSRAARAKRLYMFHHSPDANDDFLDDLEKQWADQTDLTVRVAREGGTVDLEG